MHQVRHQVDQRLRLALVADIGELDVRGLKQLLRAQIDRGARAGIAEIEFARLLARDLDEFLDGAGRHRRVNQRHALIPDREADAFEILQRVPAGVLVERRVDQRGRAGDQPRVTIGFAARHRCCADIAVAARPRFDDDRLFPVAADLFGHGAGDDVDDAAGGVGHDDADRAVRVIALRLRGIGEQHGRAAKQNRQLAKPSTVLIRLILPSPYVCAPVERCAFAPLSGVFSRWPPASGCCAPGPACAARIRARSARR